MSRVHHKWPGKLVVAVSSLICKATYWEGRAKKDAPMGNGTSGSVVHTFDASPSTIVGGATGATAATGAGATITGAGAAATGAGATTTGAGATVTGCSVVFAAVVPGAPVGGAGVPVVGATGEAGSVGDVSVEGVESGNSLVPGGVPPFVPLLEPDSSGEPAPESGVSEVPVSEPLSAVVIPLSSSSDTVPVQPTADATLKTQHPTNSSNFVGGTCTI